MPGSPWIISERGTPRDKTLLTSLTLALIVGISPRKKKKVGIGWHSSQVGEKGMSGKEIFC